MYTYDIRIYIICAQILNYYWIIGTINQNFVFS